MNMSGIGDGIGDRKGVQYDQMFSENWSSGALGRGFWEYISYLPAAPGHTVHQGYNTYISYP